MASGITPNKNSATSHVKDRLLSLLHIDSAQNKRDPQKYRHSPNFSSFTLFESKCWLTFTSKAKHNSVRYSVSISYFTNIKIPNVNKAFVYIKDCNPSLRKLKIHPCHGHLSTLLVFDVLLR